MGLDEIKVMGTEGVEVLGIEQSSKGYYQVCLCTGKMVKVPTSRVILGEEQGRTICHIIGKGEVFELPVVKNPGYVTFNKYT